MAELWAEYSSGDWLAEATEAQQAAKASREAQEQMAAVKREAAMEVLITEVAAADSLRGLAINSYQLSIGDEERIAESPLTHKTGRTLS